MGRPCMNWLCKKAPSEGTPGPSETGGDVKPLLSATNTDLRAVRSSQAPNLPGRAREVHRAQVASTKGNAIMPREPKPQTHPSVIDPDNIPETFATGPLNIEVTGPVAILTFTHARNDISDLMAGKQPPAVSAVVRARIVMPAEALGVLRDVINQMIGASAPSSITTH